MFAASGGGSISFHFFQRQNSFAAANKWSVNNTWKKDGGNKFFIVPPGRAPERRASALRVTVLKPAGSLAGNRWRPLQEDRLAEQMLRAPERRTRSHGRFINVTGPSRPTSVKAVSAVNFVFGRGIFNRHLLHGS